MKRILIDDREIFIDEDLTILEAALKNNIYIPHLCYHPDLGSGQCCRLCYVEVGDTIVLSCTTKVEDGMKIKTKTEEIQKIRKPIVLTLVNHNHMDCKGCPKSGYCKLQKVMGYMRIDKREIREKFRPQDSQFLVDESNPFFRKDSNKCVLCGICVKTCEEIVGVNAIQYFSRGINTKIATFMDKPILDSSCISCGECIIRCPTAGFSLRKVIKPTKQIQSICPYCSIGCELYIGVKDNQIVNVEAKQKEILCVKGRFGVSSVNPSKRIMNPLIKHNGQFTEISLKEAVDYIAERLKKYSGEGFSMIVSPYCTNEDAYVAQKFTREVMKSNNINNLSSFCMFSVISAFLDFIPESFPFSLKSTLKGWWKEREILEDFSCLVIAGTNLVESYPVLFSKIIREIKKGKKLIVINPKRDKLSEIADLWIRIYPGTDMAVFMGMCKLIVDKDLVDIEFIEKYCNGYEEFKEILEDYPSRKVERITGVDINTLEKAVELYCQSKPSCIVFGTGLTQYSNSLETMKALLNLTVLSGNAKYPAALIPLWGKANSKGIFDVGCFPSINPGYVKNSMETKNFLEYITKNQPKALYLLGVDLLGRCYEIEEIKDMIKNCDFIVYQGIYRNKTAEFADVVLPVAHFTEKSGSYVNFEGNLQKFNKALESDFKSDWEILSQIAIKLGYKDFTWSSSDEILNEILSCFSEKVRIEKFNFIPTEFSQILEKTIIDYPLLLITENDRYLHGEFLELVEGFDSFKQKNIVLLNIKDAKDYEIKDTSKVKIVSKWGESVFDVFITDEILHGVVSVKTSLDVVKNLLNPFSEIKSSAVRIEKV
ncbi:MAG: molybdopterin-dependent oxidoreductase [Thermodesulfovibrio sp.]|nr:molybdopterin-dependent oxidoreductase [Thermodesulfovibrio sp.]